jgi:hypothetical protein
MGIFISDVETSMYTVIDTGQYNINGAYNENTICAFNLAWDLDIATASRSVYTYFDLLAELGGLQGTFVQIAQFFLFVLGLITPFNDMTKTLIGHTLRLESKRNKLTERGELPKDQLDVLMLRKKAKAGTCRHLICCRTQKSQRILDRGESSLAKEFDVTTFLKLQKSVRAMRWALFTATERLMLKYNRNRLLDIATEHETEHSTDSDDSEKLHLIQGFIKDDPLFFQANPRFEKLLKVTQRRPKPS